MTGVDRLQSAWQVRQQVLGGDRQFAGSVAGGMVRRVGDRGRGADLPDLADGLDAERAGDGVLDLGVRFLVAAGAVRLDPCRGTADGKELAGQELGTGQLHCAVADTSTIRRA
jgi:hypothetical protein